jgi:hypothetical protein
MSTLQWPIKPLHDTLAMHSSHVIVIIKHLNKNILKKNNGTKMSSDIFWLFLFYFQAICLPGASP